MEKGMIKEIAHAFELTERQIETVSPLTFAYVGDAVYELLIRTCISLGAEASVKIHSRSGAQLAKAATQAAMARELLPLLEPEEEAVYKRGRNAHTAHSAKNASTADYRAATGFETLLGWLYMTDRRERIYELVRLGWEKIK